MIFPRCRSGRDRAADRQPWEIHESASRSGKPARGRRLPETPGEDRVPGLEGERGRGLFLVAALSACWDWYLTQEPAGMVVWRELEADWHSLS